MLPTTLRDGAYVPKRMKEEIDFDGPIERGAKKMRAQRVQEFLTLNGFAVAIDGRFLARQPRSGCETFRPRADCRRPA